MVEADARGKMVQVRPEARAVVPARVASQANLVDLEVREVVPDSPDSPVVDVGLSDHNVRSSS